MKPKFQLGDLVIDRGTGKRYRLVSIGNQMVQVQPLLPKDGLTRWMRTEDIKKEVPK